MKRLSPVLSILLVLSVSFLSGCVKGTGTNPHPSVDYKLIARGSIVSLTSLRDSFQALATGNPKYQADVDALNKILVIASPINDAIQASTFPAADGQALAKQIEDFARAGSVIAGTAGLSADVVIAINLGIGIFESIRPLIFPATSSGPVAASQTSEGPQAKLGRLQAIEAKYRR